MTNAARCYLIGKFPYLHCHSDSWLFFLLFFESQIYHSRFCFQSKRRGGAKKFLNPFSLMNGVFSWELFFLCATQGPFGCLATHLNQREKFVFESRLFCFHRLTRCALALLLTQVDFFCCDIIFDKPSTNCKQQNRLGHLKISLYFHVYYLVETARNC